MGEGGLKNFYTLNFGLMYHHKIMPDAFLDSIPWERDIYVNMLIQQVEKENEKAKLEQAARRVANKRGK